MEDSIEEKERLKNIQKTSAFDARSTYRKKIVFEQFSDSEDECTKLKTCPRLNNELKQTEDKKENLETQENLTSNADIPPSAVHNKTAITSPEMSKQNSFNSHVSPEEIKHNTNENIVNKDTEGCNERNTKKAKNVIISDSDNDNSDSKETIQMTPRKKWIGPDYKLNLKPLGMDKQLISWIQSIKEQPIMSSLPVSNYKKYIIL